MATNIDTVKEEILSCFDSEDMKDYLYKNLDGLYGDDFIAVIEGTLRPVSFKLKVMQDILAYAEEFHLDETDVKVLSNDIGLYNRSLKEMIMEKREGVVYLLNGYQYDGTDEILFMTRPFFMMEHAINYIRCGRDDWYDEEDEAADCLAWFEIEKWYGGVSPVLIGTYGVTASGDIWNYCEPSRQVRYVRQANALELNLPVPFTIGDIIRIDCCPFAPVKDAVIVTIGDNKDCCSVQCLYVDADGKFAVGALKHAQFFGLYVPQVSALYNVRRVQKDSSNIDFELNDIGALIRAKCKRLKQKTGDDMGDLLLYTVNCLVNGGCTKSQLMEGIRNI